MIKNLQGQLNEAGKIKIGRKGKLIRSKNGVEFRPPVKLNHFLLTTTEKDANGDYIPDTDLMEKIKKCSPANMNGDGNLIALPIRLVYNDIDKNFPTRYVSYVKGKLSCHGDGVVSKKRMDNFEKEYKCPCERSEPNYQNKNNDKCKPTGTLKCIIDAAGLFGQAHVFRTTSINTIRGIYGGLSLLLHATGGRIAWLPLMLTLSEKNTVTNEGHVTKVFIVSVCYRGSIEALRKDVLNLLDTDKQFFLEAGEAEIVDPVPVTETEDEKEFVEEFFASQMDREGATGIIDIEGTVEKSTEKSTEASTEAPTEASTEASTEAPIETEPINCPSDIDPEHEAQLIEPQGEALMMYERFLTEDTFDRAYSCAKRLKKGHLLWWLHEKTDIVHDYKDLKPKLLEHVAAFLNKKFGEKSETPAPETDKQPDSEKVEKEDKPIFNRDWDDSGPITKDQLRMLIKQKAQLENMGKLKPENWINHVNYFLDINGGKVTTAKNLTKEQGFTFIDMLDREITSKN